MKKTLLFVLLCTISTSAVFGADWYVKPGGSGSGSSCTAAASVNSLQTVVNAAAAGDVINLEPGNYTMTNAVNINKQLTFKGAGMGQTIIASGASALSPFSISAAGVIFRDMTIKNFSGTTSNAKAFYIKGTTGNQLVNIEFTNFPTGNVSEIVIVENLNAGGSPSAVGVTFDSCWWHDMVAGSIRSQGIAIRAANTTTAINVTVQNCVMSGMNNTNDHFPAGIYLVGGGSGLPATCNLTVTNSVFSCLTGERGGAIGIYPAAGSNYPTINITNCTFSNNTNPNANGPEGGGAIDIQRGAFTTIDKCIFDGNKQTVSGSRGGAINLDNSGNIRMTMSNCIFKNNTSTGAGAAIYFDDLSTAITNTVTNCLFHNNTASGGSTLTVAGTSSATLNIATCTFSANKGNSATAGHAIRVQTGTVNVSNTISYDNWTDGEDELSQSAGTASISTVNLEGASVAAAETSELGGTWTRTGTFVTNPVLDPISFEPTASGYPTNVGARLSSLSIGGAPGDYDSGVGGSCPSRGFNYPTSVSLCILPSNDSGSAPASGGVAVANVTANDQINGTTVSLGSGGNATIATSGSWPSGITLNTTTGAVSVAAGTPEGNYEVVYTLCDLLTPPTCLSATITLTVTAALPVQLTSFDATPVGNSVQLDWRTASEYQHDYFEIERSTDGQIWQPVGTVKTPNLVSGIQKHYGFMDQHPVPGINFYRLRQVDTDGRYSWSPIRQVMTDNQGDAFAIYPNPASSAITIATSYDIASVTIVSAATGQVMQQTEWPNENKTNTISLNHLPTGSYLVLLLHINGTVTRSRLQVFIGG